VTTAQTMLSVSVANGAQNVQGKKVHCVSHGVYSFAGGSTPTIVNGKFSSRSVRPMTWGSPPSWFFQKLYETTAVSLCRSWNSPGTKTRPSRGWIPITLKNCSVAAAQVATRGSPSPVHTSAKRGITAATPENAVLCAR